MTPDMKRLCEAAKDAHFNGAFQADIHGYIGYDDSAEAIVRAVLTALREPSEDLSDAVFKRFNDDDVSGDMYEILPTHHVQTVLTLAADHILSEPATA